MAACGAGDVDGDGLEEVLVGVSRSSAAYLFLGGRTGTSYFADADATLVGAEDSDTGGRVSKGGDVNADGFADTLVAAYDADTSEINAGEVYLVYGPFGGTREGIEADVTFYGRGEHDKIGSGGLAGGADVDGDGLDDILMNSISDGATGGRAWLVLGASL